MKEMFQEKVLPKVMDFVTSRPVSAVKDGMIATMSLTIIGSVFLLLGQLPYAPLANWIAEIGLMSLFLQTYRSAFNILAMVAVFSIAYSYVKHAGYEPLGAGILSLVAYLAVIPHSVGETGGVLPMDYLGSRGMVAAIIMGLVAGKVYTVFMEKGIVIKMPAGVPQGVADAFTALIPGVFIVTGGFLIYSFFHVVLDTTFVDFIYTVVQTPLSGLTGSFWGVVAIGFLVPFLWWFGIHGNSVIGGVMSGIWLGNMTANQALLDSGVELTIANGGHIAATQFNALLITMTGSGITIGVVIAMLIGAKSKQFKELGKLALGSAIFNINEPIIFGTPIVLNPFMLIPFVGVPVVVSIVSYLAMSTGLVPLFSGINPPWTTPPIISGFIAGGWRMALLQAVIIVISVVGYYPFVMKLDKDNIAAEEAAAE